MPKVIYIAGKGRSGSTLLDTILGQLPGVVSTGELWHLWSWGLRNGYRCGCGRPVPDCPHWQAVLEMAFPGPVDASSIARLQDRVMSWLAVPRLLVTRDPFRWRALGRLVDVQRRLYQALAVVGEAEYVVDSSKFPAHPGLLGLVPGIEPLLVHLIRDPRAVTYSYRRQKLWLDRDGDQPMPRFGPLHTATSWMARNLTLEILEELRPDLQVVHIRYEDLVRQGRDSVERILEPLGLGKLDPPFEAEDTLRLAPSHTVGGNPDRFTTGSVALQPDDEWRTELRSLDHFVATAVTWPLLNRYGYRGPADPHLQSPPR